MVEQPWPDRGEEQEERAELMTSGDSSDINIMGTVQNEVVAPEGVK